MRRILLAVILLGLAPAAHAAGGLSVTGAWSRVTPSAAGSGVVYFTVTDTGSPDTLVAASTPVAKSAGLHQSKMANGMMEMDAVHAVPVAPGKPLAFSPSGYHVMLTGLDHALAAGEHFPLTLTFGSGATVTVEVTVQPMTYTPPDAGDDGMVGMKMN
jgi:periplasmic copper chaperone A